MDRRTFLKRSGLVAGAGAFASQLPYGAIGKAEAAKDGAAAAKEVKRTVCTHCSVGCAVDATVENGVWTRQEPVFDSPLNLGAHCAKVTVREHRMRTLDAVEIADEACQRQVPENQLGNRD
jgi:formate dehydrogenase major subunit